ncbi:MAG: hypothetical protein AB1Z67_13540 [Candidatus Limnocylindrales bacterium]
MHKPLRTIVAATAAVALAAAAFTAPVAAGGPNKKGTTFVAPSETTASVLQRVLKPGKLTKKGAAFRIVGNPSKGTIKHVGGLQVDGSAGILEDSTLKLRNFRIKVADGVVVGNVEGFGKAPLFTFDPEDATDDLVATLFFTETASLAIVGVTGPDGIDGKEAGVATIKLK